MTGHSDSGTSRETFTSRFGSMMTIIGVAVGLGNVWRFPYMVGKFGGTAFVLFYIVVSVVIGVPALMAEFALGRRARRGPVGAFVAAGLPFGKQVGWFFFAVVTAATGYYSGVVGWVLYHAIGEIAAAIGSPINAAAILPPDTGFSAKSFVLQMLCTGAVIGTCATVVSRGVRSGIERTSTIIMPCLFGVVIVLMIRSLTLPGAMEGVRWYILKFDIADLTPAVMMAAIGHAIFSLSLGGTFMVVYGSYLDAKENVARPAMWTVLGDTGSALLAGFAIIPAVFALGLTPSSGPGLIFSTLPKVFAAIPAGWLFGLLFFAGLFGAGLLSDIGAFEVLVAGITDNTTVRREKAVWIMAAAVFISSLPPAINMGVFVPWDLTFGSGMQTLGALLAVLSIGWFVRRSDALAALSADGQPGAPLWLYYWIRFAIPAIILSCGIWWALERIFHVVNPV